MLTTILLENYNRPSNFLLRCSSVGQMDGVLTFLCWNQLHEISDIAIWCNGDFWNVINDNQWLHPRQVFQVYNPQASRLACTNRAVWPTQMTSKSEIWKRRKIVKKTNKTEKEIWKIKEGGSKEKDYNWKFCNFATSGSPVVLCVCCTLAIHVARHSSRKAVWANTRKDFGNGEKGFFNSYFRPRLQCGFWAWYLLIQSTKGLTCSTLAIPVTRQSSKHMKRLKKWRKRRVCVARAGASCPSQTTYIKSARIRSHDSWFSTVKRRTCATGLTDCVAVSRRWVSEKMIHALLMAQLTCTLLVLILLVILLPWLLILPAHSCQWSKWLPVNLVLNQMIVQCAMCNISVSTDLLSGSGGLLPPSTTSTSSEIFKI